eukprot:tig00000489_g1379.t1
MRTKDGIQRPTAAPCDLGSLAARAPSNYRITKLLGSGTFGSVFEAYDENGRKVALKRVPKWGELASREMKVLGRVAGHPNVIQLLDAFYTVADGDRSIMQARPAPAPPARPAPD